MQTSLLQQYKNAYSGLSASTWWLSLVMFVNRSGTMVVPFMTMYMTQHLGIGIAKAAFVMSLFGAGSIAGALIGGKVTDKIGCHPVQVFTLVGGGIMFMVLGQMKSYTSICITSLILSFVNEAFRPANAVAIAQYSKDENRTRSYSLNRLAINLGWAFGAALGGLIAAYDYQLLFWVDGITNIIAAILLFTVLSPARQPAKAANLQDQQPANKQSVYQDKPYLIFIFLQVIFALCFFQMFTIQPVYYKERLHLSESFIGANMALNGILIAVIEMVMIFKLDGKKPPMFFISAGALLVGVGFMFTNILPLPAAWLAIVIMTCITFGEMLSMPFMNSYWIARTNNNNRGQYASLYTAAWSAAQIIGPVAGGQTVERFGYITLWWATAVVCVLLAACYSRLLVVK